MTKIKRATVCLLAALVAAPLAFAGYNASAPKGVRRIFTQLAFVSGRVVSYHVLEPGPVTIQAFPTSSQKGKIYRFPDCVGQLRPVMDDSALPSPDVNHLILDKAMREVVNVRLANCSFQPTSESEVLGLAQSQQSVGFVNAPAVPGPVGSEVPVQEQQSDDELWGPLPNVGVVDPFAGGNLSPQHVLSHTSTGIAVSGIQEPFVRRPRLKAFTAGRAVYFVTYETKNLASSALVSADIEAQWAGSGFPGERDLFFLAYGRAPLPPNGAIPAGSVDSTGVVNDNQAVLNVVGGAPFFQIKDYSPLWKMLCLDGNITPTIGPGAPCGNTRFHQAGEPHSVSEVKSLGLPIVGGIFGDINCPILATDVNNDGVLGNTSKSAEIVRFPDINW